jgi:hypothetical protein
MSAAIARAPSPCEYDQSDARNPDRPPAAYEVRDDEAGAALFKKVFRENEKRVGILICYCSVLDQCWLAGGGGRFDQIDHDKEVDGCPIAAGDQFQQ